jgi:imidazolonepropionase-like amidohydrolase
VDLTGRYVVPAFGDAHHHGIDSPAGLEAKIGQFLGEGILYVKNPNVIPDLLAGVREKVNRPGSIDVVFSNGGLTATGGHPVKLHAMLSSRGVFGDLEPEDMENRAYHIIDTEEDLEAKWGAITEGKPDFIKTFLLFSEEFEKRKADETTGFKGLHPDILKAIVRKAHESELRVSTHVETAHDFRMAVEAGVDEINHLPIPRASFSPDLSAYVIDLETARRAAGRGITVVATVSTMARMGGRSGVTPEQLEAARANQKANLKALADAGVKIAIGSDGISGEKPMASALSEALYLHEHGFFDPATLLRMWTENTASTIFPGRKLGRLEEGYEADFLVLDADPLADFANVRKIGLRVKQGEILELPSVPGGAAGSR